MTTFTEKPTAITPNRELQSDEYFNETNHLIYCSKCNTPRQCRHELQGKVLIPSIRCKCQQEIFEQEEAQRKLHEKQMEIEHLKTSGLQDKSLYDYTFAKDNGSNPEMKLAHNYVSNWEEMKANASGLLISVSPKEYENMMRDFRASGLDTTVSVIGTVAPKSDKLIRLF